MEKTIGDTASPVMKYVRPNIRALQPYSTARDECAAGGISVWLDANESPYDNGVNRYPDPHQRELKRRIAALKGVRPAQVFVGNGSDEAIDLAFRIFCEPGRDNAVAIAPSYGMYPVAAAVNGVELRQVPLGPAFSLPAERLLEAADAHTRLMWVCSPNNPTGNAFATDALEALAASFDGLLVVDEAYVDFSDKGSLLPVLDRHPNLIVLQTLSKAWGMAGLRVGLAFASPEVAGLFARVKYPYNINAPTQAEAMRRLEHGIGAQVAEIKAQRRRLAEVLPTLPGVERVYPSDANFLLVRVADADRLYARLVGQGVIVRNRSRVPGCEGCLRITVGTPAENDRLVALMKDSER